MDDEGQEMREEERRVYDGEERTGEEKGKCGDEQV